MDWRVSWSSVTLWRQVRQLLEEPGCTLFYDIVIYCSDGVLPWNRLCLGFSLPSCAALLARDLTSEAEVAVSLPDLTVWRAKELLEAGLPEEQSTLHPALTPGSVSYSLVPRQEVGNEPEQDDVDEDFYAADLLDQSGYESDAEPKPIVAPIKERSPVERKTSRTTAGVLVSNDLTDYVLVECKMCGVRKPMTFLRAHTKSHHNVTITQYKEMFGQELQLVEEVLHRCELCEEHVLLDSDHIAMHLKKPGHNITHKNYNATYMVGTRAASPKPTAVKQELTVVKQEPTRLGPRRRRKKRFYDDYDLALALSLESSEHYELAKAVTSGEAVLRKAVDLKDIKRMEQLWKFAKVSVLNYKLTEEQMAEGMVDLKEEEPVHEVKLEAVEPIRVPVDSSYGTPEDPEVEKHLTRFLSAGKVIKKCNMCGYTTDR